MLSGVAFYRDVCVGSESVSDLEIRRSIVAITHTSCESHSAMNAVVLATKGGDNRLRYRTWSAKPLASDQAGSCEETVGTPKKDRQVCRHGLPRDVHLLHTDEIGAHS